MPEETLSQGLPSFASSPVPSAVESAPAAPEAAAAPSRAPLPDTLKPVTPTSQEATPASPTNGTPKPEAAEAVAPASLFAAELLERAGMTEQEATQRFKTPEAMQASLDYFSEQLFRAGYQQTQQQAAPQQAAPPQPQYIPPQAQSAPGQSLPTMFDLQIPAELLSSEDAAPFHAMNQHYAGLVHGMQQQLQQVTENLQRQAQEQYVERFDDFVDSLGTEFERVLGKGPSAHLNQNSPEYQARYRLDQTALILRNGYVAQGMTPPSERKLFAEAARLAFRDQYDKQTQQAASERVASRLRDQHGRFSAEPDSRPRSTPTSFGGEAAERFAAVADRIGLPR